MNLLARIFFSLLFDSSKTFISSLCKIDQTQFALYYIICLCMFECAYFSSFSFLLGQNTKKKHTSELSKFSNISMLA